MISVEKLKILTPFQKLPKNVGYLGKLIVAKGFNNLAKVKYIAKSGHTVGDQKLLISYGKSFDAENFSF